MHGAMHAASQTHGYDVMAHGSGGSDMRYFMDHEDYYASASSGGEYDDSSSSTGSSSSADSYRDPAILTHLDE